ncbi:AsnC family transcriptional regulator [Longispora fulva]|uniref:DNA-binding Lrp family transcriptional regulator n=1 Tax=Longispora fulva TaxID=619741 RepID=A0A8J7GHM8_9ACTN|nr:Lrp/AsnC family transcriptional regulator [Longispora fulva]MBG6136777.1 DNA-binding Lrp family transcriptional regulator [Longispora fulva]GIG59948.1 AsnC family transcriptional regulator [Longispora fulva]
MDDLDRAVVHALHVDGRVPFSRIGAVLGVSTQTVARRYRRLRAEAGLRVVGLAEPARAGRAQWMVRLTASPHTSQDVAHALARRADTSWVKLASGGTEILAIIDTPAESATSHPLLLRDIPRTASITAVSAHYVLHTYLGGPTAWRGRAHALTEEQRRQLEPPAGVGRDVAESDAALLAALSRDGRAVLADLATATGWSPATVARRLADLRAGGALFFDVEIDPALFGATTQALLWMAVTPARLDAVAVALAGHDELAFVAATTGPTNLVAHALCADPAGLHAYLTHRLGPIEGIRTLETAPVLRTLKAAGPLGP